MQSNPQAESASAGNGYGSPSNNGDKSPLSNFSFLKSLNADKKPTKDGQPQKRRGPKPDSKPAMTRRQELNRQAQRTHRERKELYIKSLEEQVMRLKEIYAESTRERDKVQQENMRLKALLQQHGISYDFGDTPVTFQREGSGFGPSSSGSISGSYPAGSDSTGFSPPSQSGLPTNMPQQQMRPQMSNNMAQLPNNRIDYDQTGIDFVLSYDSQGRPLHAPVPYPSPPPQQQLLERPCMDHMQYLVVRSHNPDEQEMRHPLEQGEGDRGIEQMSGHALMATCPPYSHVKGHPNEPYPLQMPSLGTPDLTRLLDLSSRLPLNHGTEITPIMAWTMIYRDPRMQKLTVQDFERVKADLTAKVRCYGFGAVLEEFEVRDTLEGVFAEKIMPSLEANYTMHQITATA